MKLGIIGLPNVGKKHPFQRHNKSRCRGGQLSVLHHRAKRGRGVTVPDEGSKSSTRCTIQKRTIYTTIEFCDIAGLVKGASKGRRPLAINFSDISGKSTPSSTL